MQRPPRAGLEQHGEIAAARQKRLEFHSQQCVAGIGLSADGPRRAQLDRDPTAMRIDLDVGRQVELRPVVDGGVSQPDIDVEEADRVVEPDSLGRLRAIDGSAGRHALARHFEDDRHLGGGSRPPPQPHRPGVAGRRDVAAPRTAQQQRIGVEPARVALGFRQDIAVAYESLAREIELAQHHRIAAAARQAQDGAVVGARPCRGAAPDPVFALRRGKRIDVEKDFPGGLLEPETLGRGAAPQAARMLGIRPEIVEIRPAPPDVGNLVGPIENRREDIPIGGKLIRAEGRKRPLVLCLDPGERPRSLYVFEPEVRIVIRCRNRRPCDRATQE